jgi:hypothetical protein
VNDVQVDPLKVLQRLLTGDPIGALHAQLAMREVALEDAQARIAELEQELDDATGEATP